MKVTLAAEILPITYFIINHWSLSMTDCRAVKNCDHTNILPCNASAFGR